MIFKECKGGHCRCMQKDCKNVHYSQCITHNAELRNKLQNGDIIELAGDKPREDYLKPKGDEKERMLTRFLKKLDENVFVKSTSSITGIEKNLNPSVEDQEAVIVIRGEWDREDLKDILWQVATGLDLPLSRR